MPNTLPNTLPDSAEAAGTGGEPTIVGTGWTSVLVATLPPAGTAEPSPDGTGPTPDGTGPTPGGTGPGASGTGELQSVLGSLPQVSGDWGSGRLLTSALFTVLVTDDGRVLGGAVGPAALYAAAAQ